MRKWSTEIRAIDPRTGELCNWIGPTIDAPSWVLAQRYCDRNELGYCRVAGELIGEMPCNPDGSPDFTRKIDFTLADKN
jgi:hypothetical protein